MILFFAAGRRLTAIPRRSGLNWRKNWEYRKLLMLKNPLKFEGRNDNGSAKYRQRLAEGQGATAGPADGNG